LIILKLFSPIYFNTYVNYIGNCVPSKKCFCRLGRCGYIYVLCSLQKSVNFVSDLIDLLQLILIHLYISCPLSCHRNDCWLFISKSCLNEVFSFCLLKRVTSALEAAVLRPSRWTVKPCRKQSATEHRGCACYLCSLLASALIKFVPNCDRRFLKQTIQIDTEFHAVMLFVSFIEYSPAEGVIKLMLQTAVLC
jgi:hypothetical protein